MYLSVCCALNGQYVPVPLSDMSHAPNQYPVTIQCTEASQRCQLSGKYLVSMEDQTLTLCAINTGHVIYQWPYNLLRKYGRVEVRSHNPKCSLYNTNVVLCCSIGKHKL